MSWEKQLSSETMMNPKKDKLLERAKQSWREQEGGYNKPPQKTKLGGRDCVVRKCAAVDCKHNHKLNCTLPQITLSKSASCEDYIKKDEDLYSKE